MRFNVDGRRNSSMVRRRQASISEGPILDGKAASDRPISSARADTELYFLFNDIIHKHLFLFSIPKKQKTLDVFIIQEIKGSTCDQWIRKEKPSVASTCMTVERRGSDRFDKARYKFSRLSPVDRDNLLNPP